ncbi:MAG: tRNA preQ1(34) S-adenosylmethionine ribosyltransferase-isomerase QueA [Pseudomonadota bacterium]
MELTLSQFDFHLPAHLIAQEPSPRRDHSRLMVLGRKTGRRDHRSFNRLLEYLNPGDVLVINDTQVVPARLKGKKKSGGRVECLVLNYPAGTTRDTYTTPCLIKASRKIRPGERVEFGPGLEGKVLPPAPNGTALMRFSFKGSFQGALKEFGSVPLPPYIHREDQDSNLLEQDLNRYQTVYARHPGAVAAPTAGLHFSAELIRAIEEKGVWLVPLTLHVGYGTFASIKSESISDHKIHSEVFQLSAQAAEMINAKKGRGGRVIAVGTTSVRVLEYQASKDGSVQPGKGECDLFITPGFPFQIVDGLITNFHLPRTTLLLLVSAFAGSETILRAYQEAMDLNYRFYSYGDAMLII